jgi:hypothetical protein
MIFQRIMAKARNYLLLGAIGAVVILFAAVFFLVAQVSEVKGNLRASEIKVASLAANFAAFQAENSLIAHTVDRATVDERSLAEVQSHGHDYVRSTTGLYEGDISRGWSEFFDFLRSDPDGGSSPEGGVASEPVSVPGR